MFESLFMVDFDLDTALQQQTLYNIQQVSNQLEFIADNVCIILMVCSIQYELGVT